MTLHRPNIARFAACSKRSSVGFGGRRDFLSAALGALLMMLGVSFLCAQSDSSGALGGTITFLSRAVPGTRVVLTNNATNQILTMISGENGSYRFSLLAPGVYRVSFSAPGFETSQVPSIAINVSEDPTLDASLERGDPRKRVACNCRLSLSGSSSGTLVDHKTITGIPLTTRNFAQLLSMSSGTVADVNNAGTLGRGTQTVNVNGSTAGGQLHHRRSLRPQAPPPTPTPLPSSRSRPRSSTPAMAPWYPAPT